LSSKPEFHSHPDTYRDRDIAYHCVVSPRTLFE
jgi:hypothetical protein